MANPMTPKAARAIAKRKVAHSHPHRAAVIEAVPLTEFESLEHMPKPVRGFKQLFANRKEIFISGAGGAAAGFLGALQEAERFGLDLDKIEVICGTSAGTIIGMGLVLGLSPGQMIRVLMQMPCEKFQDWSLGSLLKIPSKWGICEGKFMANYFREFIKEHSGLDNPTFKELYDAGFHKEFRVVVNNVSTCKMETWSYKNTPNISVADAVATSCNIPFIFPPKWFMNKNGEPHAYTDGGLMRHYPLREGSPNTHPDEQLGLVMVNEEAAFTIDDKQNTVLETLWDYCGRLFTMIFYRDPLCMDQAALNQSVAISVKHNPLKFKLNETELARLLYSGRKSFLEFVQRTINTKAKGESSPPPCAPDPFKPAPPVLFQCKDCAKQVAPFGKNQQNIASEQKAKRKQYGAKDRLARHMAKKARSAV